MFEVVRRGWRECENDSPYYAENVYTLADGRQLNDEEFSEYYKNSECEIIII